MEVMRRESWNPVVELELLRRSSGPAQQEAPQSADTSLDGGYSPAASDFALDHHQTNRPASGAAHQRPGFRKLSLPIFEDMQGEHDEESPALLSSTLMRSAAVGAFVPGQEKTVVVTLAKGGVLGITLADGTQKLRGPLPCPMICHIRPGSAAATSELAVGDLILRLNGRTFVGLAFQSLVEAIRTASKKQTMTFEVLHQQLYFEAEIRKRSSDEKVGMQVAGHGIVGVSRGGLADCAGVRAGHVLLSINGTSCIDRTSMDILALLHAPLTLRLTTMPFYLFEAIQSTAMRL
eukprot:m.426934 g.426934  ORF g.426934 m.426934 type:complete len:292 (+) comp56695_c0_seq1:1-876(+)